MSSVRAQSQRREEQERITFRQRNGFLQRFPDSPLFITPTKE
jgi:hypothetical protein